MTIEKVTEIFLGKRVQAKRIEHSRTFSNEISGTVIETWENAIRIRKMDGQEWRLFLNDWEISAF